jgi:molecular chaperone GrpE
MINYQITSEEREQLKQVISTLLKSEYTLRQNLREQEKEHQASNEQLYLETLEIFDALETLRFVLAENPEIKESGLQRLPKSLASIEKKLLGMLEKRGVKPIIFTESQPNFEFCRVVDREITDDIEEQTITKVVRQGFELDNQVLRPIEVITSKKSLT